MEFEFGTAIIAGLAATAVMTILMYMGPLMGIRMDMPLMLGTMVMAPGPMARAAGMVMHFMSGALFFVVYAALFNAFGLESSIVGWAALFGAMHGVMAGIMMTMMGAMHPRMAASTAGGSTDTLTAPGFFGVNYGTMAPMAIIMLHIVFGAVAGAIYAA